MKLKQNENETKLRNIEDTSMTHESQLGFTSWTFTPFFLASFVLACLVVSCSLGEESETVQSDEKLVSYFFGKRRWCPNEKQFRYLEPKHEDEIDLRNYFKIQYFKDSGKLALESSYKDLHTPVGHWFLYDPKGQLSQERIFEKGKKIEEILYEYDEQGYKRTETHFVYPNNRKRLRSKSLYFYTSYPHSKRKKLGKVEHYHGTILDEVLTFDYDLKGRLSKKTVYILNHQLKSYHLYNYFEDQKQDSLGTLKGIKQVRESIYDSKNQPMAYVELRYDSNGHILAQEKYTFLDGKYHIDSEIAYQYDQRGLLVEKKERDKERDKEGKKEKESDWLYQIQYDYDEQGCRVLDRRMDREGLVIEEFVY